MSSVFSPEQDPHMDVQTPACLAAVGKIKYLLQTFWIKPSQSHEDLQVLLFDVTGLAAVKIELFIFFSTSKKKKWIKGELRLYDSASCHPRCVGVDRQNLKDLRSQKPVQQNTA